MGFQEKVTEIKCHSQNISRVHIVNMAYPCWCWPWSPRWGDVRSLNYKFILHPPFLYWTLWKAVTTHSPHVRSGELCSTSSRMVSLHELSGILLSTVLHNQILLPFWLHPAAPSLPPPQAVMLQTCMCLQVLDSTILPLVSVLAMATLWAVISHGFLPCMFSSLLTFRIAQIPCTLRSLSGTQSVLGDFPLSPQIPSACLHHGIHPSLYSLHPLLLDQDFESRRYVFTCLSIPCACAVHTSDTSPMFFEGLN